MSFATPLWLLALLPWAAVVLYLLWGRRRQVVVPFLDLWPARLGGVRIRRRTTPPPAALALAIVATLLAVLAAGQPGVPRPGVGEPVSVIVDRGLTMSAARDGKTRLTSALLAAQSETQGVFPPSRRVELTVVPGGEPVSDARNWASPGGRYAPTAVDTRDAVNAAVRSRLLHTTGPVIVVSDQLIDVRDNRIVQIAPPDTPRNARIVTLAAREQPAAQVMVRYRGGPNVGGGKLRVTSGDGKVEREIRASEDVVRDVFIDLPRLGTVVKAEWIVDDDGPADNTAWLVREANWPRVDARTPVAAPLQRMIEVFSRQRPAGEVSQQVAVVDALEALPAQQPGIVVVADGATGTSTDPPDVADHPVTQGVVWSEVGSPALSKGGPPTGWRPIVFVGGKAWVAVREEPPRAVWVGFDTSHWARSSDFVVFWGNVFNWAGAGGERFTSHPVGSLDGEWVAVDLAPSVEPAEPTLWPGLYRRADGALRALHAPEPPPGQAAASNWRERLQQLANAPGGRLSLAPALLLAALVCLAFAISIWKRTERVPRKRMPSIPRGFA